MTDLATLVVGATLRFRLSQLTELVTVVVGAKCHFLKTVNWMSWQLASCWSWQLKLAVDIHSLACLEIRANEPSTFWNEVLIALIMITIKDFLLDQRILLNKPIKHFIVTEKNDNLRNSKADYQPERSSTRKTTQKTVCRWKCAKLSDKYKENCNFGATIIYLRQNFS